MHSIFKKTICLLSLRITIQFVMIVHNIAWLWECVSRSHIICFVGRWGDFSGAASAVHQRLVSRPRPLTSPAHSARAARPRHATLGHSMYLMKLIIYFIFNDLGVDAVCRYVKLILCITFRVFKVMCRSWTVLSSGWQFVNNIYLWSSTNYRYSQVNYMVDQFIYGHFFIYVLLSRG